MTILVIGTLYTTLVVNLTKPLPLGAENDKFLCIIVSIYLYLITYVELVLYISLKVNKFRLSMHILLKNCLTINAITIKNC